MKFTALTPAQTKKINLYIEVRDRRRHMYEAVDELRVMLDTMTLPVGMRFHILKIHKKAGKLFDDLMAQEDRLRNQLKLF